MNNWNCPFDIGDKVKPSGISYAPELDAEWGLTSDAIGEVTAYSIVDGKAQMACVLWRDLGFDSPYLLDEIVKVQP